MIIDYIFFSIFFFYLGFLSRTLTNHKDCRRRRREDEDVVEYDNVNLFSLSFLGSMNLEGLLLYSRISGMEFFLLKMSHRSTFSCNLRKIENMPILPTYDLLTPRKEKARKKIVVLNFWERERRGDSTNAMTNNTEATQKQPPEVFCEKICS